jgi:uncharacterized glyoxalase superfamily protein PhnB
MGTQISPMLAVSNGNAAIDFYKARLARRHCGTSGNGDVVDDPVAVHKRALAAGATEHSPVEEHQHTTRGPMPIKRMLQGAVVDPFGHMWLIGKFLE